MLHIHMSHSAEIVSRNSNTVKTQVEKCITMHTELNTRRDCDLHLKQSIDFIKTFAKVC
jgi:hypothetical protein